MRANFAANLAELGDGFYYSDAIEGGHAAGADKLEDAWRAAMVTVYLEANWAGNSARRSRRNIDCSSSPAR